MGTDISLIVQLLNVGLVVYIWRVYAKKTDDNTKEITEIKVNYLDRFARLEQLFNERFDELSNKIDDKYVTKEFCELQHKK